MLRRLDPPGAGRAGRGARELPGAQVLPEESVSRQHLGQMEAHVSMLPTHPAFHIRNDPVAPSDEAAGRRGTRWQRIPLLLPNLHRRSSLLLPDLRGSTTGRSFAFVAAVVLTN